LFDKGWLENPVDVRSMAQAQWQENEIDYETAFERREQSQEACDDLVSGR